MRALFKWLISIALLASFVVLAGSVGLLPLISKTRRSLAIRLASFFSRIIIRVLGVHVHVKHPERLRTMGDVSLIIANHVSYLDVLVLSSLVPSVFITSTELRSTAVLGPLARLSGCLFVERRKPAGLKQEIGEIAFVLGQGMPVALFPEGTTSNGDRVQPFKNSLFDAAVATRADIIPICLRYTRVNKEPLTADNRDSVFYYGGISFFKHLPRLLSLRSVDVEVLPLKRIVAHRDRTRKDLALLAHQELSAAYHG